MSTSESTPGTTAPVMRYLPVSDAARSLGFYQSVLGFEALEVTESYSVAVLGEVVFGAARIQFVERESESSDTRKIVFLETNNVAQLRESIKSKGGQVSELQKVNWIKMEMFEVRDPDGHTLWFGQSFDQPDSSHPRPMFRKVLPNLPLKDIPAGIAYYRDVLGFKINYAQDNLGIMDRDKIRVALVPRTERNAGIAACYVYIQDADALYAELTAKGANVQGTPVSHPWGLRDFCVLDLEGNEITFGQPFE